MSVLSQSTAAQIVSPGESVNLPPSILLSPRHRRHSSKCSLPPAVATVPPDHIRGYVHHKKINSYLVGSTLGEGSFAKVKEAFHTAVGEKVAMKVIDKKKAQQDSYVAKNFRREAKLLQMVRHPNILHLLEVIETDSSFYLITELCSGGELMKHIYKKGHLDEDEARKFMRQIVSAVDHLHKASIIHRDLKVENMLLDANMDIRIIDFGLSNEEYVQGENGITHCNTQCGSPAYAAPELLGHKNYSTQVDIWSIGVNMFAMLTGCLPYTVEPFNITALHAKMLENKMNPIPDHLSPTCKDLLKRLLRSNPDERLKMAEIMNHPWMNEGHILPFGSPFPNKLQHLDFNVAILKHMVQNLKIKDSEDELRQELMSNRSTQAGAIYYLLKARLSRYNRQFRSKPRVRSKSRRISREYYEGDEDEDRSVKSMPTKLRKSSSRQSSRHGGINLRQNHLEAGKDFPVSHPPLEGEGMEEAETGEAEGKGLRLSYSSCGRLPEMMPKEDISKLQEMQRKKEISAAASTSKRPYTRQNNISVDQRHRKLSPSANYMYHNEPYDPNPQTFHDTTTGLAPLHQPPPISMPKNFSTPNDLNLLDNDLDRKLGHMNSSIIPQAWHSNSVSRNSSRIPSRQGSRNPAIRITQPPSKTGTLSIGSSLDDDVGGGGGDDEVVFHHVNSNTLPRRSSRKTMFQVGSPMESIVDPSHLPSITGKDSSLTKRWNDSPERKNGQIRRHSSSK